MFELIGNLAFAMIVLILLSVSCTTTATVQERMACRDACDFKLKASCSTMFWTICDCRDGTRMRLSRWD
jgi:hypothetical protein